MASPDEIVEISLLSGRSSRPSISFTPGATAPTVSVGSAGQWIVTGEGVQPVHLFLAFDGQAVHVAAALADAPVLLAGSPVGKDWTRAPIPCELRFGGACLILRAIARPGLGPQEATIHDGGALLLAAQQRASAAPVTQPLGRPLSNVPSVRPAAGTPPDTARMAPPAMEGAPTPGTPDLGATVPLADPHGFHEAVLAATAQADRPPPDSAPTQVRAPPAGTPAPPLDWEKTVVAPHPPGFPGPAPLPPMPAAPLEPVAAPPATPEGRAPAPMHPVVVQMLKSWREASPAKRATALLMPFALVAAIFLMHDEPPQPPRTARPAPSASGAAARVAPSASPVASVAAATSLDAGAAIDIPASDAPASSDGPSKGTPLAPGKRTPEREALDTAAAGAFDDAAKRYDALAASHPDDPSYREAARILRAKTGH